jgi:hypothetical protein
VNGRASPPWRAARSRWRGRTRGIRLERVRAEGGRRVRGALREWARVATMESSEVSLAWAHQGDPGGEGEGGRRMARERGAS